MNEANIAVLIPVHNGLHFTSKCLKDLYHQINLLSNETKKFTIVVIDDGSTDKSQEWIKANYPETVVLNGDGSLWWGGGINKGTQYAIDELKCDYVLWWNNDIHTDGDYFRNLLRIASETEENTIIGSKIYFADKPEVIWSMGGIFNTRSGRKYTIGMLQKDSEQFSRPIEADWLPGMGTLIHRSIFEKIGYVNATDFPQYHGDSDFTFRAKLAGYRILVSPLLKIWNDKSNSGLHHYNSFRLLIKSLTDIKSNNNIGKDVLFYHKYATSPVAYIALAHKYIYYIGGFFKWKILSLAGFKKRDSQLK
ncbi:glycosyltransferase family 2 protein [Lentimicrobium sp.]|uniref:glycosyltransferase family 2 protein n=1 Tax=Lentimicrobium sp. TaxID=2034841 RepID=UPI00345F11A5